MKFSPESTLTPHEVAHWDPFADYDRQSSRTGGSRYSTPSEPSSEAPLSKLSPRAQLDRQFTVLRREHNFLVQDDLVATHAILNPATPSDVFDDSDGHPFNPSVIILSTVGRFKEGYNGEPIQADLEASQRGWYQAYQVGFKLEPVIPEGRLITSSSFASVIFMKKEGELQAGSDGNPVGPMKRAREGILVFMIGSDGLRTVVNNSGISLPNGWRQELFDENGRLRQERKATTALVQGRGVEVPTKPAYQLKKEEAKLVSEMRVSPATAINTIGDLVRQFPMQEDLKRRAVLAEGQAQQVSIESDTISHKIQIKAAGTASEALLKVLGQREFNQDDLVNALQLDARGKNDRFTLVVEDKGGIFSTSVIHETMDSATGHFKIRSTRSVSHELVSHILHSLAKPEVTTPTTVYSTSDERETRSNRRNRSGYQSTVSDYTWEKLAAESPRSSSSPTTEKKVQSGPTSSFQRRQQQANRRKGEQKRKK